MRISEVGEADLAGVMTAVGELTDAVYPGLDLSREIMAVRAQRLGDTVLIDDAAGLQGVAVCQAGAGTEAGSGACYVKFGAVRPGPDAERRFGPPSAARRASSRARTRAGTARGRCWPAGVSAATSRA